MIPLASKPANIFQAIEWCEGDTFEPADPGEGSRFEATDCEPGSPGKIEVLRMRLENGLPLWHPDDKLSQSRAVSGVTIGFDGPGLREIPDIALGISVPND